MAFQCKSIGCEHPVTDPTSDFCTSCSYVNSIMDSHQDLNAINALLDTEELDVYAVHHLFNIQDPSGCLQRASQLILVSGIKNTKQGKPAIHDIEEAVTMLTRWLQLNKARSTRSTESITL